MISVATHPALRRIASTIIITIGLVITRNCNEAMHNEKNVERLYFRAGPN